MDHLYIVVALHDIIGKLEATVIRITKKPNEAVKTARNAASLGYSFCSEGTGVSVFCLEKDKEYPSDAFTLHGTKRLSPDVPIIFRLRKIANGEWLEEKPNQWLNTMIHLC